MQDPYPYMSPCPSGSWLIPLWARVEADQRPGATKYKPTSDQNFAVRLKWKVNEWSQILLHKHQKAEHFSDIESEWMANN